MSLSGFHLNTLYYITDPLTIVTAVAAMLKYSGRVLDPIKILILVSD